MKKMRNKYKNALDGISARFLYRKLPVFYQDGDREDMSTTGRLTNYF